MVYVHLQKLVFKILLLLCVVVKCLRQAFGYACFKIFQVKCSSSVT